VDAEAKLVHTAEGQALPYDALLLALGAEAGHGVPGALTLRGPGYTSRFGTLLRALGERRVRSVVFAVPLGVAWPLPLFELALMTSAHVKEKGLRDVTLSFVTPEDEPLELFGPEASAAVRQLFEERGVELHTDRCPVAFEDGRLTLIPHGAEPIRADRAVTLPQLHGPRIAGLPQDPDGFIPVDRFGRVTGEPDVYAAGDVTGFPIKQGGLATQQADAAAEAIAARAGAELTPTPFRPVLRALMLTGGPPRYLRAEVSGGRGADEVSEQALWWPPSKIAGRYLSPYLASHHDGLAPQVRRRAMIARREGEPPVIELGPPGAGARAR
jgi:sulfide:quinone oxidoreductase